MFKNLDKKQKTELIITAIGVLFLIFLIPKSARDIRDKRADLVNLANEAASALEAPVSKPAVYSEAAKKWGSDPFYPEIYFGGASYGSGGFILNGIMWDRGAPYAIINGEIVKKGDTIEGSTVIEIYKDKVMLKEGGNTHTLELKVF